MQTNKRTKSVSVKKDGKIKELKNAESIITQFFSLDCYFLFIAVNYVCTILRQIIRKVCVIFLPLILGMCVDGLTLNANFYCKQSSRLLLGNLSTILPLFYSFLITLLTVIMQLSFCLLIDINTPYFVSVCALRDVWLSFFEFPSYSAR